MEAAKQELSKGARRWAKFLIRSAVTGLTYVLITNVAVMALGHSLPFAVPLVP